MLCPGEIDPKTGEQIAPDSCVPYKNGECAAHCPKQCGEKEMLCPGKMDPKGCQEPDFCHHGSKYFSNATWSLISLKNLFLFIYELSKKNLRSIFEYSCKVIFPHAT